MKELDVRDFKRTWMLWVLVALLVLFGFIQLSSRATTYEWVFVYYMSYDNDLDPYGETILRDLNNGIVNSTIAATVQADLADSKGMKRIALYRANGQRQKKEVILPSEDSADAAQLSQYLEWVRRNWKAKNYCIVFLNHGGTLDSMCQDLKPSKDTGRNAQFGSGKWLSASQAGKALTGFNQKAGGKVRLLFLQQCGRASIQNLYSFVDSAEYIMASPVTVDAPNTYYSKTLASVARSPDLTAETLAETIMREDEHYTVYTLVSNEQLRKLPEKLMPFLNSFEFASTLNRPQSCSPVFEFEGELFYDLKAYFQALSAANDNVAGGELTSFFSWCEKQLIVRKAVRRPAAAEASCCGLSIYVPSSDDPNTCYDFLPLYQQVNLDPVTKLSAE